MIASVHLADVGLRSALGILRKTPKPGSIEGLRQANVGIAAPFGKHRKPPMPGRVGLVSLWDDDAALDRFHTEHPLAANRIEPFSNFPWP